MDNSNYQYDVHNIAKLHKYGDWRTWNTNIQLCDGCVVVVVVVVVISYFCPHICAPFIVYRQVICLNTQLSVSCMKRKQYICLDSWIRYLYELQTLWGKWLHPRFWVANRFTLKHIYNILGEAD